MVQYKSIALLSLLGLSQSHAKGLRKNARRTTSDIISGYAIPEDDIPKSGKDERMDVLGNLDESFISLVDVVEKVDASNNEQVERLSEITKKVEAFEPALVDLEKEMNDKGADIEEWEELRRTMKIYKDLTSIIEEKFAESEKQARKDMRTSALKELNASFESLTVAVNDVDDSNRSQVEGLEKTALKLGGLEKTLEEMAGQMKEEGVEADEWQYLTDTLETFESLMLGVQNKLSGLELEEDDDEDEDEEEEENEVEDEDEEENEVEDEDEEENEDEDEPEPEKAQLNEAEERMNILNEVSELLDNLEEAVIVTDVSEEKGIKRLAEVTSALKEMEQTFQIVETQMKEKDADAQEWTYYDNSIKKFKNLATSIENKYQQIKDSQSTEDHSDAIQQAQQAESFVVDTAKDIINNGKEERMNLMKTLADSFNSLNNVVQDVHDATGIAGLAKIANHLEEYEPTFKYVETQLKEHEADTEEWNKFYDTMKMYQHLTATLEDNLQLLADSQLEQNTALVSENEPDDKVHVLPEPDEETEEALLENSDATQMDTEISIYADMLTDIHETLESGANPSSLEGELRYIQTKIAQLDQTKVTEQLDQIAVILMTKIQQSNPNPNLEDQTEEIAMEEVPEIAESNKDLELANALSEFGFPVGKEVNEILTQEGEAYELNKEEKKELAEDEDTFRK